MHDALGVGFLEARGHLDRQRQGVLHGHGAALDDGGQGLARHHLHGQTEAAVVLLDPVDLRHVGVVEGGQQLGLAAEAGHAVHVGGEVGGQELEGHLAIEARVEGQENLAHAAAADGAEDLVVGEAVAWLHGCSSARRGGKIMAMIAVSGPFCP